MFDRIIVPLDGRPEGRDVLRVAEDLANRWDASLELISLTSARTSGSTQETTVQGQAAELSRPHQMIVAERETFVARSAIETAAIDETTLVVMATSARNRSQTIYGSVASEFLEQLDQPVLLLGPNCEVDENWPSGPMLICSDGSSFSDQVVDATHGWAGSLGVHPWVVTVTNPAGRSSAQPLGSGGVESGHVARLARELANEDGEPVDYEVLHGKKPDVAILEYATSYDAALIAMATHGRTGLDRLSHGSIAMAVVHEAKCPVLVTLPHPAPAEAIVASAPSPAEAADPMVDAEASPDAPDPDPAGPHQSHFNVTVRRHSVVVHLEDAPTREKAEELRVRYEAVEGTEVDIREVHDPATTDLTAHTRELVEEAQGAAKG